MVIFYLIQSNIYSFLDKSLDKLTSLGVKNNTTRNPLAKLLLTTDNLPENRYNRSVLSSKGYVSTRIEVSFYGRMLKKINLYQYVIKKLIPQGFYNLGLDRNRK